MTVHPVIVNQLQMILVLCLLIFLVQSLLNILATHLLDILAAHLLQTQLSQKMCARKRKLKMIVKVLGVTGNRRKREEEANAKNVIQLPKKKKCEKGSCLWEKDSEIC